MPINIKKNLPPQNVKAEPFKILQTTLSKPVSFKHIKDSNIKNNQLVEIKPAHNNKIIPYSNSIYKKINYQGINQSEKDYYYGVYPLASCYPNTWYNCVNFFYPEVPASIVNKVGGPPPDPADTNYAPPPLNSPWIPVWYPPGAFAINRYPPNSWWCYPEINSTDNCKYIEVTHVPDDQDFYTVQGTWFYVAKGSGVFLDIGKSLIARNKIDALKLLKVGPEEMARLYPNGFYMVNVNIPYINFSTLAAELYPQISDPVERLSMLFTDAANISTLAKNGTPLSKLYNIDRINNSADFDQLICQLARAAGYDTVQFVTQANGNGGWNWELVFVNQPLFLKTDAIRMSYITPRIYLIDPCNHSKKKHCEFDPFKKYTCIYCYEQTSNYTCRFNPEISQPGTKYPEIPPSENPPEYPTFPDVLSGNAPTNCPPNPPANCHSNPPKYPPANCHSNPPKYPPNCCSYPPAIPKYLCK